MRLQAGIETVRRRGYGDGMGQNRGWIPAPVKGLNTRDPISKMDDGYAVQLINFFPHDGRVSLRRGYEAYATAGSDDIESLFPFRSGATLKFFAAGGGKIHDITTPDSPVEAKTGQDGNIWHVAGGETTALLTNGLDTPQRIAADGTISDAALTVGANDSLTLSRLTQGIGFKGRVFMIEKDTAKIWYTAAGTTAGALAKFNVGLVHGAGGSAVAMGRITLDSGLGTDDLLAIFMESGHVLLYAGTNPASADDWRIAGVFTMGRVIGERPIVQLGPDLIAITADGYIPVLPFLKTGRVRKELELSDAISSLAGSAVRENAALSGWQAIYYPAGSMLIFNVGGAARQHVMNTQTGAWCVFDGMAAGCWAVHEDRLYFGGNDGIIYQADIGTSDAGSEITARGQTAFTYFGTGRKKTFNLVRSLLEVQGNPLIRIAVGTDFGEPEFLAVPVIHPTGTPWGTEPWGTFKWARKPGRQNEWQGMGAEGGSISLLIEYEGRGDQFSWFSSDLQYEVDEGV